MYDELNFACGKGTRVLTWPDVCLGDFEDRSAILDYEGQVRIEMRELDVETSYVWTRNINETSEGRIELVEMFGRKLTTYPHPHQHPRQLLFQAQPMGNLAIGVDQ